jgi:L-seryl-tRNA(Ser) seleniumtransferase
VALPAALAAPLRLTDPPVVGRVADGRLLLDLLAVPAEADDEVAAVVRRLALGARTGDTA